MRAVLLTSLALLGVVALVSSQSSEKNYRFQQDGILLEPLRTEDLDYGCGCFFHVPIGDKGMGDFLVTWLLDETAKIRVNGHLTRLRVVSDRSEHTAGEIALGQKRTFLLENDGVSVHINCTTSRLCEPGGECESIGYDGEMLISDGAYQARFEIRGGCGC